MGQSEDMTTVGFGYIEPDSDYDLDLENPLLAVDDLSLDDMVCCLTACFYLNEQEIPFDDIASRFGVREESASALVVDKLPTHSWWQCLISRAREVVPTDTDEEVSDWGIIGNFTMGFYGLHVAFEDYPMPLGDMIRHYIKQARQQARQQSLGITPLVEAVSNKDVSRFLDNVRRFEEALERRTYSLSRVRDGAINSPALKLKYYEIVRD